MKKLPSVLKAIPNSLTWKLAYQHCQLCLSLTSIHLDDPHTSLQISDLIRNLGAECLLDKLCLLVTS